MSFSDSIYLNIKRNPNYLQDHFKNYHAITATLKSVRSQYIHPCRVTCYAVIDTRLIFIPLVHLDLGFLIDGSQAVGSEMNFMQVLNFVRSVVRSFDISSHTTRVGLAVYSLEAFVIFNFHTYFDVNNIDQALSNVQWPGTDGPGTYIGRGTCFRLITQKESHSD